jgi:hypothetical protein
VTSYQEDEVRRKISASTGLEKVMLKCFSNHVVWNNVYEKLFS